MADLVRRAGPQVLALKPPKQQDRGPRTKYLAFRLDGDLYAAPVSLIRKILTPPPLIPIPRAPEAVLGIISDRGMIVTVIDLRKRLRLRTSPSTGRSRILLVDATEGELLGLYVDEVLQVYRLAESEIELAATALGAEVANHIAGIARPSPGSGMRRTDATEHDGSVVILLDLRAVLSSEY
jgi:purine-binding chemotaxis protein CheW